MNSPGVDDGSALTGMAMLGKTAAALALIVILILLVSYLLKRFNLHQTLAGQRHMQVVSSVGVGQRERVVIVEVDKVWLILGVGGGQVNKLHELPAPAEPPGTTGPALQSGGFASRFSQALKHQLTGKSGPAFSPSSKSQPR